MISALVLAAQQPAGAITLALSAVAIVLFVNDWLAPEVTGLPAVALLATFRVLQPDQALQGLAAQR